MENLKRATWKAQQRAIVVPVEMIFRREHASTDPLVAFVSEARDWPQPMQDDLIPILMANGFKTQAEQDAVRKAALLRAAALDPYANGWERAKIAKEYGRPNAIRIVWWLRRRLLHEDWDG